MIHLALILAFLILPVIGNDKKYTVPDMTDGTPEAGKRVKVTPPEYTGTQVYYSLYLPKGYSKRKQYPVIVEYTGNYWPTSGSTGEVKDANLGYALAEELEAIWVVMPYISEDGLSNQITWWGSVKLTTEFCIKNLRRICMKYKGNPAEIFICGFSRGAVGVNYLGLHNEEMADIWLGFFTHDGYDGLKEYNTNWGKPHVKYRRDAAKRIKRLDGRTALICQNKNIEEIKDYIEENNFSDLADFTFMPVAVNEIITDIPNEDIKHQHTDKWLCYNSQKAKDVFKWFRTVIKNKPGTYSVQGRVLDRNNQPVPGVIIESANTHFAITDKHGNYKIEGLKKGGRIVRISDDNDGTIERISKNITLNNNITGLNFTLQY